MKKVTVIRILAAVTVISSTVSFFSYITANFLNAIIVLILGIMGCIAYCALATAIEDIDSLKEDIKRLKNKDKDRSSYIVAAKTSANAKDYSLLDMSYQREFNKDTVWICKNCGTKNEAVSQYCKDCGRYK